MDEDQEEQEQGASDLVFIQPESGNSTVDDAEFTASQLQPGNMLGPYRIEHVIAQGGMGTVYHAEHIRLGRAVVLKVLHTEYENERDLISRFLTEAHAVNQIDHENIVEITDFVDDRASGMHYLVMECLHGRDLADLLDAEGSLSIDRAVAITVQIASALHSVHEAGIIHRDLKPENIFLTERHGRKDYVKILDFGVAKLREDRVMVAVSTHKTTPGTVLGTPRYMSPEQACTKVVDHRTDIYSLGVILYHMVTGRVPFDGKTIGEILGQQMEMAPVPPSRYADLSESVPASMESLILKCLAKEPEKRPQSMKEVQDALETIARSREGDQIIRKAPPTPRTFVVVGLLMLASAVIHFNLGWYGRTACIDAEVQEVRPIDSTAVKSLVEEPNSEKSHAQPEHPGSGFGTWGKQGIDASTSSKAPKKGGTGKAGRVKRWRH